MERFLLNDFGNTINLDFPYCSKKQPILDFSCLTVVLFAFFESTLNDDIM